MTLASQLPPPADGIGAFAGAATADAGIGAGTARDGATGAVATVIAAATGGKTPGAGSTFGGPPTVTAPATSVGACSQIAGSGACGKTVSAALTVCGGEIGTG